MPASTTKVGTTTTEIAASTSIWLRHTKSSSEPY